LEYKQLDGETEASWT